MKDEDSELKKFTDAAHVIESSMDMWGKEFDKWADIVEDLQEDPSISEDDISYAARKMDHALNRMRFEQKEARDLNHQINAHMIDKFVRGDFDE